MTKQEIAFVLSTMEDMAKHVYKKGYEDGKAKKPSQEDTFKMTRANVMRFETELQKAGFKTR